MKLFEERILREGTVAAGGIIKVDSFLNHQIDVDFVNECGREFHRLFADDGVTRILTVEASGIGIACLTAQYFHVPVVFAKKAQTTNLDADVYSAPVTSYTHKKEYNVRVARRYINPGDRVLIIDDFLAMGNAIVGLCDIVGQAGAQVAGVGICVEKGFQEGGERILSLGVKLRSLAIVNFDADGNIVFEQRG